jgi:two-component system phosphate regulon sensor histidine kinase PhoR
MLVNQPPTRYNKVRMIVFDLKLALFVLLVLLAGLIWLIGTAVHNRRTIFPLQTKTGGPALDTAPVGIVLLDRQTAVAYANNPAQRLLSDEVRAELLRDAHSLSTNNQPTSHYRIFNLPGERALSWWIYALDQGSLVLLTDLSQQRQTERSSQLFLNSLSHELRTPLTAVLAHLEVLRSPDLPGSVRDNSLQLIHQETNRIARLVQSLLDLSRLETVAELERRPTDLLLLAEEAIADVILDAETRQIAITLHADTGLSRVLADPDKLKQVFLNVLDNGMKYGRSGDKIEVNLRKNPGAIGVSIRDTGPGIPAEHLPHVGQRLYRARTDIEGSGLGLALVSEILRRHQSELIIESETDGEETGTAVSFTLPIA